MISEKAKKQFLSRKLRNFDFMKDLTKDEINEALADMKPKPQLKFGKVRLWLHQKVSFLIMYELKRFLLFLDMGNGKSLVVLSIIDYRKKLGHNTKAIVFVPYITAVGSWMEECEEYVHDLKCLPLIGDSKQNLHDLVNNDADIVIACYQTALAAIAKKSGKKGKWKITAAGVRKHFAAYDMIVMDEIHRIKSVNSMYYRMCRAISLKVEWAFGLTGTPFGRDLSDLWAQFYVIDKGETLGPTLGLFRAAFFTEKINYWGGYVYKFRKRLKPLLHQTIKHSSIRYSIDECHDMPKKIYLVKKIDLPEGVEDYYEKAQQKLEKLVKSGGSKYEEIRSTYIQMRQLSSGFMTFKGEDNERVQFKFPNNPKLDVLLDYIDDIAIDRKIIIFHEFIYTNKLISDALKKKKIPHARVWGGAKDKLGEIRRFKKDKDCRVIVMNSKSGSSALNLQVANYVFFFEEPMSPIDREQAERRSWRPGQKRAVRIIDLHVKKTLDEKAYKSNKEGKDLLQSILDGKEKV